MCWRIYADVYGMLVHSCQVEDGQGQKMQVVDERGSVSPPAHRPDDHASHCALLRCHVDRYIMGDPTYTEALDLAYRESHVFKFADRVAVRFQCQIKLCLKENGGCNGITVSRVLCV